MNCNNQIRKNKLPIYSKYVYRKCPSFVRIWMASKDTEENITKVQEILVKNSSELSKKDLTSHEI